MRRWHAAGWLSFDPDKGGIYDDAHYIEVLFIRALARFGFSDAMINRLLTGLEKPYCYDPGQTFYSFSRQGWVTMPPEPEYEDLVTDGIEAMIHEEQWSELEAIRDRIEASCPPVQPLEGPQVEVMSRNNNLRLAAIEKRAIEEALRVSNGNREEAARLLGIGERTVYRKLREYGLG
jgi:DNA-binding protein Fis